MLSDDLAQETFIRIWERLPNLSQPVRFSGWAYRIAYNLWIDQLRRRKASESLEGVSMPDEEDAGSRADTHDVHKLLLHALAQLNESERTTITLFYLNELSIKEIVAVTSMNEGTVKSILSRARAKLRELPELKEYYDNE